MLSDEAGSFGTLTGIGWSFGLEELCNSCFWYCGKMSNKSKNELVEKLTALGMKSSRVVTTFIQKVAQ